MSKYKNSFVPASGALHTLFPRLVHASRRAPVGSAPRTPRIPSHVSSHVPSQPPWWRGLAPRPLEGKLILTCSPRRLGGPSGQGQSRVLGSGCRLGGPPGPSSAAGTVTCPHVRRSRRHAHPCTARRLHLGPGSLGNRPCPPPATGHRLRDRCPHAQWPLTPGAAPGPAGTLGAPSLSRKMHTTLPAVRLRVLSRGE